MLVLTEDNFLIYAMKMYDVPTCINIEDFQDEIKRFGYINRAFKINAINTRLILNHIIILYNVFGEAATRMLMFKIERENWKYLIPFLLYLDRLSITDITEVANEIVIDEVITRELKGL